MGRTFFCTVSSWAKQRLTCRVRVVGMFLGLSLSSRSFYIHGHSSRKRKEGTSCLWIVCLSIALSGMVKKMRLSVAGLFSGAAGLYRVLVHLYIHGLVDHDPLYKCIYMSIAESSASSKAPTWNACRIWNNTASFLTVAIGFGSSAPLSPSRRMSRPGT